MINKYRIQIVRSRRQCLQLYSILKQSLPIKETQHLSIEKLENEVRDGNRVYYLFEVGQIVIGEFDIRNIKKKDLTAYVGLGIPPKYQNSLYSSLLVLLIMNLIFRKNKFSEIFWTTRIDNIKAIKLWRNMGATLIRKDNHCTYWKLKHNEGLKILNKYSKVYLRFQKYMT